MHHRRAKRHLRVAELRPDDSTEVDVLLRITDGLALEVDIKPTRARMSRLRAWLGAFDAVIIAPVSRGFVWPKGKWFVLCQLELFEELVKQKGAK